MTQATTSIREMITDSRPFTGQPRKEDCQLLTCCFQEEPESMPPTWETTPPFILHPPMDIVMSCYISLRTEQMSMLSTNMAILPFIMHVFGDLPILRKT